MADPRPAYLAELLERLGDFPARYGKPTTEEREALRCTEPTTDLEACHRVVSEELTGILAVLDQYDYREIPRSGSRSRTSSSSSPRSTAPSSSGRPSSGSLTCRTRSIPGTSRPSGTSSTWSRGRPAP